MKINTYMITESLQPTISVRKGKQEFISPSIQYFCYYESYAQSREYLYLIHRSDLDRLTPEETACSFFCLDPITDTGKVPVGDIIYLESAVPDPTLINSLISVFQLYNNWEKKLLQCPEGRDGLQKMLDASRKILPGMLILSDHYFNYVAFTREFFREYVMILEKYHGRTPDYVSEEILTAPSYYEIQNIRQVFRYPIHVGDGSTRPALCYNLFRPEDTQHSGRLLYSKESADYTERDQYLLQFLGEQLNRIFRNFSPKGLPGSGFPQLKELIKSFISEEAVSDALVCSTLNELGWSQEDTYYLVNFNPVFLESKQAINAIASQQIEFLYPESCSLIYRDSVLLLINGTRCGLERTEVLTRKAILFLREHLYKAGISCPFHQLSSVLSAYRESAIALELGGLRHNTFWYYCFEDYALDYIIERSAARISRESLSNQGLLTLREYDSTHNTAYAQTLRVYLEQKFNVSHAAQALFIHRTTLLKYLERIVELTSLDLSDWETRTHLMLSYRILDNMEF